MSNEKTILEQAIQGNHNQQIQFGGQNYGTINQTTNINQESNHHIAHYKQQIVRSYKSIFSYLSTPWRILSIFSSFFIPAINQLFHPTNDSDIFNWGGVKYLLAPSSQLAFLQFFQVDF